MRSERESTTISTLMFSMSKERNCDVERINVWRDCHIVRIENRFSAKVQRKRNRVNQEVRSQHAEVTFQASRRRVRHQSVKVYEQIPRTTIGLVLEAKTKKGTSSWGSPSILRLPPDNTRRSLTTTEGSASLNLQGTEAL